MGKDCKENGLKRKMGESWAVSRLVFIGMLVKRRNTSSALCAFK